MISWMSTAWLVVLLEIDTIGRLFVSARKDNVFICFVTFLLVNIRQNAVPRMTHKWLMQPYLLAMSVRINLKIECNWINPIISFTWWWQEICSCLIIDDNARFATRPVGILILSSTFAVGAQRKPGWKQLSSVVQRYLVQGREAIRAQALSTALRSSPVFVARAARFTKYILYTEIYRHNWKSLRDNFWQNYDSHFTWPTFSQGPDDFNC